MLEMRDISKTCKTEVIQTRALNGLDVSVNAGDFVAVTGPSGSGKTTFLNVAGLLETFDAGSYKLDGMDVAKLNDDARSRLRNQKIGFIFQSFNLIPDLDLFDNVDVPLRYRRMPRAERKERIEHALNRVGLSSRYKHLPSQLSGGQQQRVAIVRALAGDPLFLLADKPTGNLDSWRPNHPFNPNKPHRPPTELTWRDANNLLDGKDSLGRTVTLEDRKFTVVGVRGKWEPMPHFYDVIDSPYNPAANVFIPLSLTLVMKIHSAGSTYNWNPRPINSTGPWRTSSWYSLCCWRHSLRSSSSDSPPGSSASASGKSAPGARWVPHVQTYCATFWWRTGSSPAVARSSVACFTGSPPWTRPGGNQREP